MKIDRLFSIVQILVDKKTVTAPELASHFGVSTRTIYRDIEDLIINGIPIYSSQGKGGGISILDNYSIDKSLLSDDEQKQVLLALQSVNATGQIDATDSLTKLRNIFKKNNTDWIEIDFSSWEQSKAEKDNFELIKNAIIGLKVVEFLYFSNKGEASKRIVEPIKLVFKGSKWYLYGYCRSRKDFRFFKLARIDELSVTKEVFARREISSIKSSYIKETTEFIKVKLKIDISMSSRVYDEFRHGKITFDKDKFVVEAELPKGKWMYEYFLGYGSALEVLQPNEVRNEMKIMLKNILNKY